VFSSEVAIALSLLIPVGGALLIPVFRAAPNLREGVTLVTAAALFAVAFELFRAVAAGERPSLTVWEVIPGLALAFEIEPLGMLFGMIASGLWIVNSLYSIGYMRGAGEKNQTRFFMFFALAIAAAMGIAFAANMFTLFVFYEVLTLSTFPLVTHKGNEAAAKGGRIYLGVLMSTSIGFLLTAAAWTYVLTGTLDFTEGGVLEGKAEGPVAATLLALYVFGTGKAALMPFHAWLPNAMVAPTPVSALLHAVAVVKAGVFTVLKVAVYIFGVDYLAEQGISTWLMWIAAGSILIASLIAMQKDNLKARLAYSTVSQLSYVTLGAMLATAMGVMGGAMQIAMHAFGKMTLFMCAGAVYVAAHETEISRMRGLGRVMPFTFGAFFVGALSIIGLPPLGGTWTKFYLMLGAADAGELVVIFVLMLSSLLNVAYLLPIAVEAFYPAPKDDGPGDGQAMGVQWGALKEAPLLCVAPACFTAAGSIVLFFAAGPLYRFLEPLIASP